MTRNFVPILASLRPQTRHRFFKRLRWVGDCQIFEGGKNPAGYGIIDVSYDYHRRRYPILTHRLAWALEHGIDPPPDRIVCHKRECTSKACCNPKHLYLGTPQANHDDSKAVGTAFPLGDIMRGRKGVAHPRARYSAEKRTEVIEYFRHSEGIHFGQASRHFGIPSETLSRWWREYETSLVSPKAHARALKNIRDFVGMVK